MNRKMLIYLIQTIFISINLQSYNLYIYLYIYKFKLKSKKDMLIVVSGGRYHRGRILFVASILLHSADN